MDSKSLQGVPQEAMTTTLVLALPYSSKKFILECDALDYGIQAIIQQGEKLVAFFSKTLVACHYNKCNPCIKLFTSTSNIN